MVMMMGNPKPPEWRDAQCPERGPALTHVQDVRIYADGRCIVCEVNLTATPPPVDVSGRLQAMGLMPGPSGVTIAVDQDDIPREPRCVYTPEEAAALPLRRRPPRGNGELTDREQRKLIFNCEVAVRHEVSA